MVHPTILFVAANPPGTSRLALDEEARAIEIALDRSPFALKTRWAARRGDSIDALRKCRPAVVHFAGHGGSATPVPHPARPRDIHGADQPVPGDLEHGLFFQGSEGQPEIVSTAALAEAFRTAGSCVKLVVLNACYSDALAQALLPHVDCVVGMRGSIDDAAARAFAACFYGGLGESESIAAAHGQGCADLRVQGLPDSDRPQLKVRDGLDAGRIVLAGPAAAARRPGAALPYELPHADRLHAFAGREAELAAMQAELLPHDAGHDAGEPRGPVDRQDRPVFVLTGPSGIGKSMLAQKFAADHRAWFDAAVYLTASSAEAMAQAMAVSLRASDSELRARDVRDVLAERCGDRRVLLTINDAHEIQPLKTLLDRLLPPEVAVIITTQHRSLSALAPPKDTSLGGSRLRQLDLRALAPGDALALFIKELGEGAAWTRDEARRICEVLGYHPHALHVVARNCGRDGLWTLSDFIALFCAGEDRKQLLEEGLYIDEALRLDADPKPLESVLDQILAQLEKEPGGRGTAAFYSCLAACDPAGFSVEAAAAAAGCDSPAVARGRLNRLHRHALVDQLSAGNRYALQTLFAASATWRARTDGTHDAARVRHARFWMTRLRAATVSDLWLPADLRAERGDLALAATRAAEAGELDVELIEQLNDFFDRAQLPERAVQTMTAAIGCADALDRAAGVLARIRLAKFRPRSEAAATLAELESVRALVAGLPDAAQRRALEIKLLVRMGALQKRSDRARAVETLERAVALARECGDFHAARHALDALARVHREAGRFGAALDAARESVQGDPGEVSVTERFLGGVLIADCLVEQDELAAADARYRECSRLGPRPASLVHLAGHLLTVAQDLRDRGRLSAAIQIVQLQTEMASDAGDEWLEVRGLIVLGGARVKAGDIPGALEAYRALSVDERRSHLRDTRPVTGALRKLARDLGEQGHPVGMEQALELAGQIATAGWDFATQAILCNRLAHCYRRTRPPAEAEQKFREQIALGKRHGLPIQQAYGYVGLAALHRRAERFDLQIECCQAALDALSCPEGEAAIDSRLLIHTELALGFMRTGRPDLAVDTLVQIGALRSLARTPASSTRSSPRKPRSRKQRVRPGGGNPAHDVAEMLLSGMELSAILRLLRDRFAREATPRVAGALAPVALQLARLVLRREPAGVAWSAPLLLALELANAVNAVEPQRGCLDLLRSIARPMRDSAADPARWSIEDVASHAQNRASTAYPVLSGFLAADRAMARAQAQTQAEESTVTELLAAGEWALGCPIAVVRSYVCDSLASWFREYRLNDHAERFYRAGIDACVAVNDQVHLSYTLVSLCSVLRRFEGREAEALDCLVRLADGPVRHLADTEPVEHVLNELARHFGEGKQPDPVAWLKAARALVAVAKGRGSLGAEVLGWNHQGRALAERKDVPGAVDAFEHQILLEIASQSGATTQYGFSRFEETLRLAPDPPFDAPFHERAWLRLIDRLEGDRGSLATLVRARAWCCLAGHRVAGGRIPEACSAFVHAVLARGLSSALHDTLRQIGSALERPAIAEQAVEPLLEITRTTERSRQEAAVLVLREVVQVLRRDGRTEPAERVIGELERRGHAVAPRPAIARPAVPQADPVRPHRLEQSAHPGRQELIKRRIALLQRAARPRSSPRRGSPPRS